MLTNGSKIGGFVIQDLLGRGAMGEVYKGEQISLKRPVAIKRIASHLLDDKDMIARFEREGQVLAKVNHPNVVGIYEFGRFNDEKGESHYLLVMELIDGGKPLKKFLAKPIDWRTASACVRMACEGLAAAMEHGIVHRDIKPDNIMINSKGIAKLCDFGLARGNDSAVLTMQAVPMGTPAYMSPEACRGEEIGHAGDLYSLGCSWFELLTGHHVFRADNWRQLLLKHENEAPPNPLELMNVAPEPVVKLLYQCLEKDAAKRPPSAQWLAQQIEALALQDLHVPRTAKELYRYLDGGAPAGSMVPGAGSTAATMITGAPASAGATAAANATAATLVSGAAAAQATQAAQATLAANLAPQPSATATAPTAPVGPSATATAPTAPIPKADPYAATITPESKAAAGAASAPAAKSKAPLIIGVVVAVAAIGGLAAVMLGKGGKPADPPQAGHTATPVAPPPRPAIGPADPKPVATATLPATATPVAPPPPLGGPAKPETPAVPATQAAPATTAVVAPTPRPEPKPEPKPEPPATAAAPATAATAAVVVAPLPPPPPPVTPATAPAAVTPATPATVAAAPATTPAPVVPAKPAEMPKSFTDAVAAKDWPKAQDALAKDVPAELKAKAEGDLKSAADADFSAQRKDALKQAKDRKFTDSIDTLKKALPAAKAAGQTAKWKDTYDTVKKAYDASQQPQE